MACLYCGKEIGPIRILRDKEFCSPKHRKEYKDRLQRVLVQVGEPETVPRDVAPFQDTLRPIAGSIHRAEAAFDFSTGTHRAQLPRTWSLAVPETRGSHFADLTLTACDLTSKTGASAHRVEALPYFGNTASAALLSLPEPKLGTLVLRSTEGQLLSEPIALAFPSVCTPSAKSPAPNPVLRSSDVALPAFGLSSADCEELAPSETWMPAPEADPLTVVGEPAVNLPVPPVTAVHVPESLPEAAVEAQPVVDEFATPPLVCETWMPGYRAEPAARLVQPAVAPPLPVLSALRLPSAFTANLAAPQPAPLVEYAAGPEPQIANVEAKLAAPLLTPLAPVTATPGLASLQIAGPMVLAGETQHLPVPASEPAEREVTPVVHGAPVAFSTPSLQIAALRLEAVQDAPTAPVVDAPKPEIRVAPPRAAAPLLPLNSKPAPAEPRLPERAPLAPVAFSTPSLQFATLRLDAVQDPLPAPVVEAPEPEIRVAPPRAAARKPAPMLPVNSTPVKPRVPKPAPVAPVAIPAAASKEPAEVPQAGLFAVDYHSPAGPLTPVSTLLPRRREAPLFMPRFAVRPVFDRLEEPAAPKRESKKPAFAEIFSMPAAAAVTRRKATRHAFTAIAASVTVAMALWFGANAGKFGKELINREAEIAAGSRMSSQSGAGEIASASSPTRPAPDAFKHPVSWIRTEAAKHAAVQVADSFDGGMAAWGAKGKAWAAGWSHSADGYVRPGQLALFQPTLSFTDYRMEFFGQIENKSMSWVVRGKDTQNYYAMKFNVVEPGLRPVISMIHYPVVGGKQGHRVVTPLSVMVHGDTPYHVAVEVKGSHYTASIEGQEVDSWSDDTLLAGGVGFFADAGSRARIYWMKVTKNDDWFGHLCNYLAGSTDAGDTAWLDRPALPAPTPESPAPAPATASLWPAEVGESWSAKLQRGKGSVKGEIEKWSS